MKIKYKGNTLPEVLIALCITSFCASLAVIIYLNIQQSTMPFIKLKANVFANKYLAEAILKKDFFDKMCIEEEYTIKKTIKRNPMYMDCLNLRIDVFDVKQKKLSELETTIYAE